jgi:hypothetical protein
MIVVLVKGALPVDAAGVTVSLENVRPCPSRARCVLRDVLTVLPSANFSCVVSVSLPE